MDTSNLSHYFEDAYKNRCQNKCSKNSYNSCSNTLPPLTCYNKTKGINYSCECPNKGL